MTIKNWNLEGIRIDIDQLVALNPIKIGLQESIGTRLGNLNTGINGNVQVWTSDLRE